MRYAVPGCHTDYQSKNITRDIMFFRFPNDKNLSKEWIVCKREDKINVKNARICSKHFDTDKSLIKNRDRFNKRKRTKFVNSILEARWR